MKKRLLSALLALALVFVLLPTTALAGVTTESNYDISIDGKRYKFDSDGSGGYTTAYYQENNGKTPTSNYEDVWQTNPYLEITRVDNIITITVKIGSKGPGKSVTIGASTQDINYECIAVNGAIDLIITGDTGTSLTLNKTYCGAALSATKGNITITDGVKVTASFKNKAVGNYVFYAIWAKNLTVSGANTEVTASGNCEDAIHVSGTVTVSKGAKLTATNDHNDRYKPYPITKSSAIKSDVLTIADENSCVIAQAIDSSYGKPLRIQNYNIAGATIKAGSSNYNSTETTIDKIDGNTYVKISVPALTKTSDVLIAGKDAVVGVETSIPSANGSGTYFYDQASKTLTLKDVNIASSSIINGIQFTKDGTYTINLVGTNTMSGFSTGISANSADQYVSNINITITGAGSLEVSTTSYAIAMNKGNLKFENTGEIKLTTSNPSKNRNVLSVSGNITITDMDKYSVTGITQTGNLNVTGDTVTLSEASHLKGYQNPDGTAICLKTITITPTPAKDSTISYGNKTLKQGEIIKGEISGTATVATKGNTITLNNFNGTQALSFEATLADSTLVLEGTNTLSSIVTTQKGLTISVSGSGSLTVGSIRVPNNTQHTANLTINGATVTVGTAELNARAIDVNGSLTVTGASLTATSASDSVPTVQVGGNASFTGSTVTITNNSTTQGERYKDSYEVSSALHVNGAITISGGTVTAEAKAGGDAIRAVGNITVSNDATVTAKNNSQYFSAITAGRATGGEVNTLYNLIVSGENTRITATNAHDNKLAYGGAINAYIKNANEGHYLKANTDSKAIAPNDSTTVKSNDLTITRGDAYETPQVAANYTIAGQTMYVGKYYKTDTNGNITDGTAQDYNIFCDSANDFTLNNATISSTGTDVAINTNIRYETNVQHHIKLIGTNRINNTFKHAISAGSNSSTIIIEGVGNASDASLTINGNFLPIYSDGKVIINAEVVIVNTTDDNSFKGLISTSDGKGAFDLGSGYKCYASTSTTGTPLEEFNSANYSTYKYLRVTTQTLETGGGSTCQHDWDEAWHDTGDGHHAHQCTKCQAFDTAHQQAHDRLPDESKGLDKGHTLKCGLCGYKYDQSIIESHVWSGWETFEQYFQLGDHAQRCNCGQLGHRHLKGELVYRPLDSEYHQQICSVEGCGYPGRISKSEHVYEENSDICKYCGYDKSAPCDHTGDLVYTNNGDGTHKVTCKACGATLFEKQNHKFDPATGACVCGATQSGGDPTPDNPGTIVIIRPAEEEKPAQQPNPSTGANDLVGLAVAAAVAAALGSAALLRKHD